MWLQLEVGTARSLRWHVPTAINPAPMTDSQGHGRRALVIEAAHTYFPEAGINDLPALAREEIAAGLGGRLRRRIAESGADDPALPLLRDELVARLGGTADATGALTVIDRVYAGRLLRHVVPPIITASCAAWYGYWRSNNGGPSLAAAEALSNAADAWVAQPSRRSELDIEIIANAQLLAGGQRVAPEDLAV